MGAIVMRSISMRVLPALLLAAACSSVPARDYAAYSDTFTRAVQSLTALRAAGKIDDASYRQISPVIHAADAAFDRWKQAIVDAPEGATSVDVPKTVVEAVLDAIDQLVIWQAKLSNEKGTVTTNG